MGVLYLLLWGCVWGRPIRRLALLRRRGIPWQRLYNRLAWGLGLSLYACMAGQMILLWRMGAWDWRQALPLHLCSFVGVITLPVLRFRWRTGWGFCLLLAALDGFLLSLPAQPAGDRTLPGMGGGASAE